MNIQEYLVAKSHESYFQMVQVKSVCAGHLFSPSSGQPEGKASVVKMMCEYDLVKIKEFCPS